MDGSATAVSKVKEVKFIQDFLGSDGMLIDSLVKSGVSHIRARRVEAALVIHGFRIGVDAPVAPENATAQDLEGYWFEFSPQGRLYHAMPPKGILPNAKTTNIAHPFA